MTSPAETAYAALQTLLEDVAGINLVSRREQDSVQTLWEQNPSIFIKQLDEEITPQKGLEGMIARQELHCVLILFMVNNAPDQVLSTAINNMLYSIRQAIAPPGYTPYQTLGGTVSHCWVKGKIEIIEGAQDNQSGAIIPVSILTNY